MALSTAITPPHVLANRQQETGATSSMRNYTIASDLHLTGTLRVPFAPRSLHGFGRPARPAALTHHLGSMLCRTLELRQTIGHQSDYAPAPPGLFQPNPRPTTH